MLIARRGQGMVEQAGDCITERRQHPASVIKSTLVPESNKSSSYYPHSPASSSSQQPGAWAGGARGGGWRQAGGSWALAAVVAWPGAVSLVPGSGRAGCGHLAPTHHNNIASTTYHLQLPRYQPSSEQRDSDYKRQQEIFRWNCL